MIVTFCIAYSTVFNIQSVIDFAHQPQKPQDVDKLEHSIPKGFVPQPSSICT
jgi:hypothetical protein